MRLTLLVVALLAVGCADDAPAPAPPAPPPAPTAEPARQTVASVVDGDVRLQGLSRALDATGLRATLADTARTYTLFAPSDEAFVALGLDVEADSAAVRSILLGHVLSTRMMAIDVFPDLSIETLAGTEIAFAESGEGLAVVGPAGTVRITTADIDAGNGVIHILDGVLTRD